MAHIRKCLGNSKTMGINLLKRLRHAMAGFRNYNVMPMSPDDAQFLQSSIKMLYIIKYSGTSLMRTPLGPRMCVRNMEASVF